MRTSVLVLAVVVVAGLVAGPASLQESGPTGPSPYDVVDEWMTPFAADGYAWGSHPGVAIDSPNRIFVIQRGEFRLPDPLAVRICRVRWFDRTERASTRRCPCLEELYLHCQ